MVDSLGMVNAVSGSPSYTGRVLRQLNGVGFAGATASRPLGARSGVRPGTPASTVTATSTTWTVQSFGGLIDEQVAAEAGPYSFAFDAVASGAMTAASASFARVDIIYVQVADPAESDGSSVPAVTRKYLAGTVASTPPATPARSFVTARINVPILGGGSPTVTWVAPYCAAAGGVVNFNTKAEMDLWTTAIQYQRAIDLATGIEYRRVSGVWVAWESAWMPYTPTLTGFTPGAGGIATFLYRYVQGNVEVDYKFTLGPGGGFPTQPVISAPVPINSNYRQYQNLGRGLATSDGGGASPSMVTALRMDATNNVGFYAETAGGATVSVQAILVNYPAVWVVGGGFAGVFSYRPA